MSADILTNIILPVALFLIMFGMGLSLRWRDFEIVVTRPKALVIGLFAQMLLLPLIALIIAIVMQLPPEIAVGLMIIALAPGGATSNMFTYLARGDVSLSISMTALVSLIAPFTIPVLTVLSMLFFMGNQTEFSLPLFKTIIQLLVITVIPVILGMLVLKKWPHAACKIEVFFKWFSVVFLILIIMLIVLKNRQNMLDFFAQAGLATLLLNVTTLLIAYHLAKLARLTARQSVSIGFEVGIQNGTLALLVAGTLIGNELMMIPAVTYSLIMFVSGAVFGWWIHRSQSVATK